MGSAGEGRADDCVTGVIEPGDATVLSGVAVGD